MDHSDAKGIEVKLRKGEAFGLMTADHRSGRAWVFAPHVRYERDVDYWGSQPSEGRCWIQTELRLPPAWTRRMAEPGIRLEVRHLPRNNEEMAVQLRLRGGRENFKALREPELTLLVDPSKGKTSAVVTGADVFEHLCHLASQDKNPRRLSSWTTEEAPGATVDF